MNAVTRLASHIERTFTGPMWHGPSLREALHDVSPATAAARPIASAHSIWELVLHMTAWADIARQRLGGDGFDSPSPTENFPPVTNTDAAAWPDAIAQLEKSYQALGRAVARVPEERLSESIPTDGPRHSVLDMLHGVIEHGAYHGGQIAILKHAAD
ncbi:MAG: DinB family protein [bacterium]